MTQNIHAPYHFVPLSSWVYMPEWAHLVSHDHPFEAGISGVIEYELTNATPLLVGGNSQQTKGQPSLVSWAKDPDGKPIIPGTSLKGMLRNVLEIATFSKFDRIDDHHFAYRDLATKSHYLSMIKNRGTKSAWLSYDSEKSQWSLRNCRHIALFNDDFNQFSEKEIINEASQKPEEKYSLWPLSNPAISFVEGEKETRGTKGQTITVACAERLGDGNQKGYPVFIGCRPGGEAPSLNYNYLFYNEDKASKLIDSKRVAKMFAAHDKKHVDYLQKNTHPILGIPVFIGDKKGKNPIMGFAKMPKLLYEQSVVQVAKRQQKALNSQSVFDFSELLFGTLAESGFSLKSRVIFADAHLQSKTKLANSKPVILGQPKASYLNAYLEQGDDDVFDGNLSQYEASSKLSGWKRYPTQTKFNAHLPFDLANKTNVQSQLELMDAGNTFKGKVVFHNLQPIELGALLWAFNPEKKQGEFFHGLGHGKSLGAGAIQFKTTLSHYQTNNQAKVDAASLRQVFIDQMNKVYPAESKQAHAWENSPQIRHLLAFGDQTDNKGKNLTYMPLNDKKPSYCESKKNSAKPVLPAWRENNKILSRKEQLENSPTIIGRGRLKDLVEQLEKQGLLSNIELDLFRQSQQAQNAENEQKERARLENEKQKERARLENEKQAAMAVASPIYKIYLELNYELKPYAERTDDDAQVKRQQNIENLVALLNSSLEENSQATKQELQVIYEFLNNYNLTGFIEKSSPKSKKGKEKYRERKAKLEELKTRFDLESKA